MRWWDIAPVLDLERELFPEDAWSAGMFWSELAHARGPAANRRYVVAELDGRLVGYGAWPPSTHRRHPDHRHRPRPVGHWARSRLLTELLSAATAFECAEVLLEVRVDNTRAQRLYERFGFEPIGFRRGYYQPGNVDASSCAVPPSPPPNLRPIPGPGPRPRPPPRPPNLPTRARNPPPHG